MSSNIRPQVIYRQWGFYATVTDPITAMGVGHTVGQGHLKEKVLWLQKIEGAGSMDPPWFHRP